MIGEGGYDEEGERSSISLQDDTPKNVRNVSEDMLSPHRFTPILNSSTSSESTQQQQGNILQNQFAYIRDGTCTTCNDVQANETALTCFLCKSSFHAVCRDAEKDRINTDVICPRTFFKSYSDRNATKGVNSSRFGTFTFVCNVCKTRSEQNSAVSAESKVDLIDRRVNNLSQSMEDMKGLLMKVVNMKTSPTITEIASPPSPAPVAPSYRSVLIMSSTKPENQAQDCQDVDKIIKDNAIHADKRYVNKKGEIVVVCPTTADRENLVKKVSQQLPEMKTHQPPERLPTISVANLADNYSEKDLEDLLLQAHPNIEALKSQGEIFSVLKVKPQIKNSSKNQATIRVSNNIRKIIEQQGDRLYISSFSCKVYDQFHVKRCNNCQGFGHYRSECESEKSICGYCSKNHPSEDCPENKTGTLIPCCINCSKGKYGDERNTHTAFDRICPAYVAEQQHLRKTINYYSSKNS